MVPKLQNMSENRSKLAQVLFLTIYQICKIILQSSEKKKKKKTLKNKRYFCGCKDYFVAVKLPPTYEKFCD